VPPKLGSLVHLPHVLSHHRQAVAHVGQLRACVRSKACRPERGCSGGGAFPRAATDQYKWLNYLLLCMKRPEHHLTTL
jgi:hypothetical protein